MYFFCRKYPKCPKIYLLKLSAQTQKFWISMKKGLIGRPQSVPHLINLFSKAASFFMLLSHGRAAGLAPRVLLLFKTFCWYYCGFAPKRPGLGLVQQAQPKHGSSRLPCAEHSCHNIVSYCCDVKNVFLNFPAKMYTLYRYHYCEV